MDVPNTIVTLAQTVRHCYESSGYYQRVLCNLPILRLAQNICASGPHIENIAEVFFSQFRDIPITTRNQLQSAANAFAVSDQAQAYRLHSTSGTSGITSSIRIPYSQADIEYYLIPKQMQQFARIGLGAADSGKDRPTVMISLGYGLMTAGFEWESAVFRLGNSVIPCGPGILTSSSVQIQLMKERSVTVLCCTPSYAGRLLKVLSEVSGGMESEKPVDSLRMLLLTGEYLSDSHRNWLEERWGVPCYNMYGAAEVGAIGGECNYKSMHLNNNLLYPEPGPIVQTPKGAGNLLLLTTVNRRSFPLIRYAPGDAVKFETSYRCPCRSEEPVIQHLGRCDDLIKFKGRIINPVRIEELLREIDISEIHTAFDYQIRIRECAGEKDKYSDVQEGVGIVVDLSFRRETPDDLRSKIEETFLRKVRAEFGIAVPLNRIECGPGTAQLLSGWKSKRVTRSSG